MDGGCERFPQIGELRRPQGYRCHIQCRDDSGRDVHTRNLPLGRLDDSPDAIFDKPKAKVPSDDTNFPDSISMAHGSCRKNNGEAGSLGFEVMNQTSTRSEETLRTDSTQCHHHSE